MKKIRNYKIGIDASRAFVKDRTGIEEYSYQVIRHLREYLNKQEIILYIRPKQSRLGGIDFKLPANWRVREIKMPRLWTQVGLSLELLFHPVDVLFVPGHTVPMIKGKRTIVTIHGLEYEKVPEAYSKWERLYMRSSIRNSCRWASKIIAVSENTKQDLVDLYRVPKDKVRVVYEGVCRPKFQIKSKIQNFNFNKDKYLLFIGRIEERKNIKGIVEAFGILKKKYKIPHKLILAGRPGYNYDSIKQAIDNSQYKKDIISTGYITEQEKWQLLKNSDIFLFPSFYEGFGLPILEAQSVGVPVVTSDVSSMPEVVSKRLSVETQNFASLQTSALLVNPHKPYSIAKAVYRFIEDQRLRSAIIEKGYQNIKRFSWQDCARDIAEEMVN